MAIMTRAMEMVRVTDPAAVAMEEVPQVTEAAGTTGAVQAGEWAAMEALVQAPGRAEEVAPVATVRK
jgi:hypothetical protein